MKISTIAVLHVSVYFRISLAQKEYLDAFNDELDGFKSRVKARAKQKIEEAIKEHEEVSLGWDGVGSVSPVSLRLRNLVKHCCAHIIMVS